jgi:uncharacterized membrane protein
VIVEAVSSSPRSARWAPRHAATPAWRGIEAYVAILALIALLVPLHRWWPAQILLIPLLFTVPGAILLRALRIPGRIVSTFPVYIPCAAIIVLFGSGLAVDLVGPLAGVGAPLRPVPLLASFELTCVALLATSFNSRPDVAIAWRPLLPSARVAWPLALPLVAAAGALRLNSGHGNSVALIAVIALVLLLATTAALASRLDETLLKVVLYAAGLALGWSYSLRGDGVYGFDISTEYQRLEQTIQAGVWHAVHPNDAYGAMLSVTVMPAELHALSGVSGLLVLKVVYPVIYALFPIAIFDLARRILPPCWAFIAAAFTMGQYAFTEIVSVSRQEIAFLLFAALIAAMLDRRIRRRSRWSLVVLLSFAMALSHYSTTYVAITVIGFSILLQWAASWIREIPRITGAVAVAFVASLGAAIIWYVPVTQSDSHLLQVAQTVQAQGLNILPNRVPGGSFLSAYLQGNNTEDPIPARQYQEGIRTFYVGNRLNISPVSAAYSSRYDLSDSPVPEPPVKWRVGYDALGLGFLLIEQLVNVLAAIGGLLMVLRRRSSLLTRQIGLLALATTLLLTVIRFSGTLAAAYGQERAQLQGLVLLAVSLCWAARGLAEMRRARQAWVPNITAGCLAVVLVSTTYLAGAVLGGGTSANLANSGVAFEHFDITAPELASAQWLGNAIKRGQLVYADEYAQLPLVAATGMQNGLLLDVTPQTLNDRAWVYADRTNVTDGRAFALFDNDRLATYVFPSDFLTSYYDLVYTNGSSEVFHR